MTLADLSILLDHGGVIVLLLLIIGTGHRGYWVFRRELDEMRQDRDQWREIAQTQSEVATRSMAALERQVLGRSDGSS